MAQRLNKTQFKSIILLKSNSIGIGSYGAVCKAKCDDLLCAAKILHPTLFDLTAEHQIERHREHRLPMRRFEQECEFMSAIRHPNIVQYLGTHQDPETGLLVLLMELMDDSLTHFLECSKEPIPFHIQVNISHDIATALSFLHSNDIIHRDMSSNNVLLIGNSRVKITDFGMAKLGDMNPQAARASFTMCPGTDAYMPPEATEDKPRYTEKIDCFSFGVLGIQIMTREFPKPGDRMKTVFVSDPQFPNGIRTLAPEIERRKDHISQVDPNDPLLPISLSCLKDKDVERPSAQELCSRVAALKQTSLYRDSEGSVKTTAEMRVLEQQLQIKNQDIANLEHQLETCNHQIRGFKQQIMDKQKHVHQLEKQLMDSLKAQFLNAEDLTSTEKEECKNPRKNSTSSSPNSLFPTQSSFVWKRDVDLPMGTFGAKGMVLEGKLYIGGGDSKDISIERVVYEYDINGVVRKWTALPQAPVTYFSMAIINKSLTLVGGMDTLKKTASDQLTVWDKEQQKWTTPFPPMLVARQDCSTATYRLWLIVAGGLGGMISKKPMYTVELFDCATSQWHTMRPLPQTCFGMTSCIVKNTWYLMGGIREKGPKDHVYSLNLDENLTTNNWNQLPDMPHYCSTAVPFGDFLMAVGGTDSPTSRTYSTSMFIYSNVLEKWMYIGNIPTPRSQCTCVVMSKGRLILLGGKERTSKYGKSVEILYC